MKWYEYLNPLSWLKEKSSETTSYFNEYNAVAGTITFQSGINTTLTNSFGTVNCIGFY